MTLAGERILVVDDDPAILQVVAFGLGLDGFDVVTASDGKQALIRVRDIDPDLVILDLAMPEVDGVEVCRRLRADPRTSHLPVIMLTARTLTAHKINGLDAGADDYITKPFDPEELSARVTAILRRAEERRAASPLTGLPGNRRIDQELQRRIGQPVAIGYADLNDFKPYNDEYGFLQGDRVLQATAWLLREVQTAVGGEESFLGHVGGDDFILICTPSAIEAVCEMATTRFDALAPTLYPAEDARRGYVEQVGREGTLIRFPLVSLTIGVATTGDAPLVDHRALAEAATRMKRQLKESRTGTSGFAVVEVGAGP